MIFFTKKFNSEKLRDFFYKESKAEKKFFLVVGRGVGWGGGVWSK